MMMRALYSLLTYAAQPWVRRKLARRAKVEPLYGQWVEQRFGHYGDAVDFASWAAGGASGAPVVWLHAVSLGETRAAAVLLARLREALPGMRLVLTHGTATGREAGKALLQPGDVQVWQPWDTPAAVGHFLARFRPNIGLLMETEVWPNLVAGCAQCGVPLCLVNARMSDKTYKESLRLRWLAGPAYRGLPCGVGPERSGCAAPSLLGCAGAGGAGQFQVRRYARRRAAGPRPRLARWRRSPGADVCQLTGRRRADAARCFEAKMAYSARGICASSS